MRQSLDNTAPSIDDIRPGKHRRLSQEEIESLAEAVTCPECETRFVDGRGVVIMGWRLRDGMTYDDPPKVIWARCRTCVEHFKEKRL